MPVEKDRWLVSLQNQTLNEREKEVLKRLEQTWEKIKDQSDDINLDNLFDQDSVLTLTHFAQCGYYPPPEILFDVSRKVNFYEVSRGKVSLDEALFANKHSKKHNPAYLSGQATSIYGQFHFYIQLMNWPGEVTMIDKVTKFFSYFPNGNPNVGTDNVSIEHESFLRGYYKWKDKFST